MKSEWRNSEAQVEEDSTTLKTCSVFNPQTHLST